MAQNDDTARDDAALESFFSAARDEAPVPSAALLARIMADADQVAEAVSTAPVRRPAGRGGLIAALAAVIGGWPALAGMATATAAGVWIGIAQPAAVSQFAGGLLPSSATEYSLDELSHTYEVMTALDEGWAQ